MELEVNVNSYVSLEEADEYFSDEYLGLSAEIINTAKTQRTLILATRAVDGQYFHGAKKDDQRLQFPRDYQDAVPDDVKHAQLEESLAIATLQASQRARAQLEGVKSISVGKASETYVDDLYSDYKKGRLRSAEARRLLRPYTIGTVPHSVQ